MTDESLRSIAVRNPRSGDVDYHVACLSADEVSSRVDDLKVHQAAWQDLGAKGRAAVLYRFAEALASESDSLSEQLAVDTGRRTFAQFEVFKSIDLVRHWADRIESMFEALASHGQSAQVPTVSYQHLLIPYRSVAVISPWNVPLLLALIDSVAALAAGCAVILKPSEVTPRFAEPLARAISKVPELDAVFTIVTGDADTGRAMIDQVDAVCFTGSVATGQKVALHAAQRFIPAFLELGGKDPAIVMPSANIPLAARAIIRSGIGMTGQACQSLERIYCHKAVYNQLIEELARQLDELTLTTADDGSGDIAPLIFPPQADTIQRHVDDALAQGARVLRGGQIHSQGGNWYPPTLIVDVTHEMTIMREETFGPVIPVVCCDSEDEAVALANDSKFGLSGAVFSQDIDEAKRIGGQLSVGAVSVNDASLTGIVNDVEKNSFQLSGMGGSRMGPAGLTRFLRKRALLFQQAEPAAVTLFSDRNDQS